MNSKTISPSNVAGAGLGFRRDLLTAMKSADLSSIDFFEVSPENWINSSGRLGGRYEQDLRQFTERFDFVCHGLSLSIGSTQTLDFNLLGQVKSFMADHNIDLYTEHLSWCSDETGHLYDLLPIPCTTEAVHWVADRIRQAQDFMGRQIGFENASYYYNPKDSEMSDAEFISAVCEEADCLLHLDINNIYVNSQNFGFDPHAYLRQLPVERTCYMHVAGHYIEDDGFIVDTHGNAVIDAVWALLNDAYDLIYQRTGKTANQLPTCLERDFNFPSIQELVDEVDQIHQIQKASAQRLTQHASATENPRNTGNAEQVIYATAN